MTLLSIREQEAVKAALLRVKICADPSELDCPRCSEFTAEEIRKFRDPTMDKFLGELILATRDAIARQVREEGEVMGATQGLHPMHGYEWRAVATFIEGLPCE